MTGQANGRRRGKPVGLIALLIVTAIRGLVPDSQLTRLRSVIDPHSVRPTEATYATQSAQLRTPLADRSLITQNVSTVLHTRMSPLERGLTVETGEVLADIAPDTSRLFVIRVGGWSVRTPSGAVWVKAVDSRALRVGVLSNSAEVRRDDDGGISKVVLHAGDIATFTPDSIFFEPSALDDLLRRTAWRRNEIWLSSDTLADAVQEFNRYSERKIVIRDRWTAAIRISGRYYAADTDKFIRGLRPLYIESRALPGGPRSPDVVLLSMMSCAARPTQLMNIRNAGECNRHLADSTPALDTKSSTRSPRAIVLRRTRSAPCGCEASPCRSDSRSRSSAAVCALAPLATK